MMQTLEFERNGNMALELQDLTVCYNKKPAIWDAHLAVPSGTMTGIIGPNGAGKSTLLRAILDITPKSAGTIRIYGRPYYKQRRLVAYIPQRESVDWHYPITALDLVTMGLYRTIGWCRPVRARHRQQALETLDQVGMREFADRQISRLSGGQQQRIFLARALVQNAEIYFLDEPFVGVDAKTERVIVDLLSRLRRENKNIFVVHHDLRTVADYFDWLVMVNTTIIADGPTSEVFTADNLQQTYGGRLALMDDDQQAYGLVDGTQ